MAYTFDAKTEASATSTGLTVSHSTGVGANLLVCSIGLRGNQTVTMTYGGVSLTLVDELVDPTDPERTAMFYLVSPTSGANNLIVSLSGSVLHQVSISTYTADAGTPTLDVKATASNNGSAIYPTVTLPASTGLLGVDVASSENNASPPFASAGGDQTILFNSGSGSYGIGSSYELSPSSGEVFNWLDSGGSPTGQTWVMVAAIFSEGAAAILGGKAIPDFRRKAFPFLIGDSRVQGVSRSGARWRVGGRSGPSPIGGFERFIFPRLHPDYPVGGTIFNQAVDATATATASITNSVGKIVTATATSTATMSRSVGKLVTATATSTASIVKSVGKKITANATATATIAALKVLLLALTATVTSTATILKSVGKNVTANATSTATIVKQVGKKVTATATSTATIASIKVLLLALTATVTSTATMVRQVGKKVTVTATSTATIVKSVGKRITATATSTATIGAIKVILKALTATVTSTATITRQVGLHVTATVTAAASVMKSVGLHITATVTTLASLLADSAGAIVTYFMGRARPRGMGSGSPASTEYEAGTPGGSSDPGSPSGDFYDPPTPGRG